MKKTIYSLMFVTLCAHGSALGANNENGFQGQENAPPPRHQGVPPVKSQPFQQHQRFTKGAVIVLKNIGQAVVEGIGHDPRDPHSYDH